MSATSSGPETSTASPFRFVGPILSGVSVAWAWLMHQGLGPDLAGSEFSLVRPSGFLIGTAASLPIGEGPIGALAIGAIPALVLAVAVFATTRSGLARALSVICVIAAASFSYYGVLASGVWDFFKEHWSGTMVTFSIVVGGALSAVLLARSWRNAHPVVQVAWYLPLFIALVVFERNVTGTNPTMAFAISPWPATQVFGMETIATCIAFVILGVGAGLWTFARLMERLGSAGSLAVGAVVGVLGAPLVLYLGSLIQLPPIRAGQLLVPIAIACAVTLVAAGATLVGQPARLAQRARLFVAGGVLLLLPLFVGQALTRWDYVTTRDGRAQIVIDALHTYFEENDGYPETLEDLVETGALEELPEPRIGFSAIPTQDGFVYQNFGNSYLLEFWAPRWIQCAYNPPYQFDDEEERQEAIEAGEDVGGAWSCPSNPPELW